MKSGRLLLLLLFTFIYTIFADNPAGLHIAAYLQHVTQNSIIVRWETTMPVIGNVDYGQAGNFDKTVSEMKQAKIHEIKIEGLKPNETYNYRVKYADVILEPASFTTAPPQDTKTWRFVLYGDNRSNPDTHRKVVKQIINAKPRIVVSTGDLVARGKNYLLWKKEFFDPLQPLIKNIPIYVSLGNHEEHAQHYFDYFSFPDPENEQFYSFDYANVHFVALDSDVSDLPNSAEFEQKQFEWLKQDLELHKDAQWKIVFFHHPLFNAHPYRDLHALHWQPLFEEYGVDLVLNGHDHYYCRDYAIGNYTGQPKRGVQHIISGGGGAPLYPVVERIHAAYRRSVNHIVAMDVVDDRIMGRAIDTDGNVFDSFVVDKQAEASAEEFIAFEMYQIEKQLKDKIKMLPEIKAQSKRAKLKTSIVLHNPFTVPVKMYISWNLSNDWSASPLEKEQVLNPGEDINIPINITGPNKAGVIPPQGKLTFSKLDGEKAFRNDALLFFPLKLWSDMIYSTMMTSMLPVTNKEALLKYIVTIPLPIISMDGTVHPYKSVSDDFPADGLDFGTFQLSGKIKGEEFNNELAQSGYVRLRRHNRMEIRFETDTKFKSIVLDLMADKLNEKLCIGEFKLKAHSAEALKKDELFAEFGSSVNDDVDLSGWLKITAYAKNGIAGEFEIRPMLESESPSILKGRFKLPFRFW